MTIKAALLSLAVVCLAVPALAERSRVVLVTQEKGYVHGVAERRNGEASVVESTLERLGRESGVYELESIGDVRLLGPRLKGARAVIFFTSGQLPFPEGGLAALENWVKEGGGVLFLHGAADTLRSNGTWRGLVGAAYAGQPWNERDTVTFKLHDPAHPACRSFGETFTLTDTVHQQGSFERGAVRTLISVDMERTDKKRPGHVPVAWCREVGKGKTFYTNLGHGESIWRNPAYHGHLLGAIRWLLNVEPGDAGANPEVTATEEAIIQRLAIPVPPALPRIGEGLAVQVFAQAPQFHSPASMCASADGRIFVGEDEYNTGDDRKPGNSRVKLLVDTDGDGAADRVTVFADNVCSPQGMVFVGDTLFVVHAPYLSAFRDTNGDGVADERRDLITGFGPAPEGLVHHIPSGVHMGIDGFLYITVGDKGIVKATGTDGRTVSLMGGGIVRVRADGSEMELFSTGLRNPYAAAPDPLLNLFMRDNTNDGGGWNSRLSQMQRGAEYGYPSLYLHFGDEIVPPIADYGGGGATGGVFVSEPLLPKPYGHSLYTIDWARSWVYRHNLAPAGATFRPDQEEFIQGAFPTSISNDARGRLYVASWGRMSWSAAPPTGTIHTIQSTEWNAPPFPDLAKLSDGLLVEQLTSASGTIRREAQWEVLRRNRREMSGAILSIARSDRAVETRVAALFTYAQLAGPRAMPALAELSRDPVLREHAIRAMADRPTLIRYANAEVFAAATTDTNPRVRAQAAIALGKYGRLDLAGHMIAATVDADVMVRHAAQQSLRDLHAVDACVAALAASAVDPSAHEIAAGVLRTVRGMHDPRVIDALATFLTTAPPSLKKESIKTLQRLYTIEAAWDGSWWLTRPDTRGPNYRPAGWGGSEAVGQLFTTLITDPDEEVAKSAIAAAGHVRAVETAAALAGLVGGAGALKTDAIRALIELRTPGAESLAAIESVITTAGWEEGLVEQAIETLGAVDHAAARATLVRAVQTLDAEERPRTAVLEKAANTLSARPATGEHVERIAALLGAKHRPARVAAALSLARSSDAGAKECIARLWQGNEEAQVEALLAALPSLPADAIQAHGDQIKSLLKDRRPAVRHAAIAVRPKLGDPEQAAVDLLAAASAFRDRQTATRALADIEPGKVADAQILLTTALLAETAAALSNSPDQSTYARVLAAAQRSLADARVPRERAAAWIRELKQSGVLAEYMHTDPIPADPGKAFSMLLPPDQAPAGPFSAFTHGEKPYEWKPVLVTDPAGLLPLAMPANTVVFLHATHNAGTGGAALLTAGSDDGLQVYLNGKKVLSSDTNRPAKADQDRAVIHLQPGTNTLLLRVNNNAGDAGVQVRIRQRLTEIEPSEVEAILKELPPNPERGRELYTSLACASCHTTDPHAAPRGPYLGDAGAKMPVPHLIESLLRPSAKIAQGFATVKITTPAGEHTGWITTEAAESITLLNAAGQATILSKMEISKRETLAQSTMPDGLLSTSSLEEFSALMSYLASLDAKP